MKNPSIRIPLLDSVSEYSSTGGGVSGGVVGEARWRGGRANLSSRSPPIFLGKAPRLCPGFRPWRSHYQAEGWEMIGYSTRYK